MEDDDIVMEDSYHSYSSNEEEEEYHDSSSSEDEELTWETKPAEDWKKVDVENCFQMCKDMADDGELVKAIAGMEKILEMEPLVFKRVGKWSFKAHKKLVTFQLNAGNEGKCIEHFQALLSFTHERNGITETSLLNSVMSILDSIPNRPISAALHESALSLIKAIGNEALKFKTGMKLCQQMLTAGNYTGLSKLLDDCRLSCLLPDGSENPKKEAQLLEVYSLSIQMAMALDDQKKMEDCYRRGMRLAEKPGALDTKMGIFHFVGGLLKLESAGWDDAYTAFFRAFCHFQDSGSSTQKIPCMRYLVLSCMLSNSSIDPFYSAETRSMKTHKDIVPMANLLWNFQVHDLHAFRKVLGENKKSLLSDRVLSTYLPMVLTELRRYVLIQTVKPYRTVTLPFLAERLSLNLPELLELLLPLVLDRRVHGRIDCVSQKLFLDDRTLLERDPYSKLCKWSHQLGSLNRTLCEKAC